MADNKQRDLSQKEVSELFNKYIPDMIEKNPKFLLQINDVCCVICKTPKNPNELLHSCNNCQSGYICQECCSNDGFNHCCPLCKLEHASFGKLGASEKNGILHNIKTNSGKCIYCGKEGSLGDIFINHLKECDKAEMKCENIGCNWKGKINGAKEHDLKCEFKVEKCSCGMQIVRHNLQNHKDTFCQDTMSICRVCHLQFRRRELFDHYRSSKGLQDHWDIIKTLKKDSIDPYCSRKATENFLAMDNVIIRGILADQFAEIIDSHFGHNNSNPYIDPVDDHKIQNFRVDVKVQGYEFERQGFYYHFDMGVQSDPTTLMFSAFHGNTVLCNQKKIMEH